MAFAALLFYGIILLFFLAIGVLIGVYVYRDAGKHGMNQLLWALIAVLVPSFLGLVIYFLARNNTQTGVGCPGCSQSIRDGFEVCPHCGYELVVPCSSCGKNVSREWKLCPWCRQELPQSEVGSMAGRKKNGTDNWIIIAVISLIVLVFIGLGVAGIAGLAFYGGSGSSVQIASVGTNSSNGFSQRYEFFSGTKSRNFHMNEGESAMIQVDAIQEKGTLTIVVTGTDGKVVRTLNGSTSEAIDVKADKAGECAIQVIGKKTTGSYNIKWNINSP